MDLLFARFGYDVDIYVDILYNREEGVAGENDLSGYRLAFGIDISHT
jgi:hypothetical protein